MNTRIAFDLNKASHQLSELELKFFLDNLSVNVLWFRALINNNEWSINRHTHSTYEFHFVFEGSCNVFLDDTEFTVSRGEFYLTAPGVFHEQQGDDNTFVELCINCDLQPMNDIISESRYIYNILTHSLCRPFKDTNGIINLFMDALSEAYNQQPGFINSIKSIVTQILIYSTRIIGKSSSSNYEIPMKKKKNDYRLTQIKQFIEDNMSHYFTISDISAHLYLSEKQVYRIIKDHWGLSPRDLISQLKHLKAKKLLIETNLPIKTISDLIGFSNVYSFTQFFKHKEGNPPARFRKNIWVE